MKYHKLYESWHHYLDEAEKFTFQSDSLEQQIQEIEKLKEDIKNGNIVFFDTETTGINAKTDQIVQLFYSVRRGVEGVEKEQNIVAFLTPESMERFAFKEFDQQKKKYIDVDNEQIKDKVIKSLENSLETIERKNSEGKYTEEEYNTKKNKVSKELESATTNGEYIKTHLNTQTREVFIKNHYLEKVPQVSEKDMLIKFVNVLNVLASNKNVKLILCAHNIDFDARMVNERCSVYGIKSPLIAVKRKKNEPPNAEDNVILLDSLIVAKNVYKESLEQLLIKYEDELKQGSKPSEEQTLLNALSQLKPDLANSFEKLDLKGLKQQLLSIAKEEGYSQEDFKKLITHLMRIGTTNALQTNLEDRTKFSAKLSDLAKTIKINPENAHDAAVDVKMMIEIFNYMLEVLNHVKLELFNK